MGLFTAYLDASGSSENESFVVTSGYIANFVQWNGFDSTWKEAHRQYDVELPFHMADFVAATKNPKYSAQSNARHDYLEIAKYPDRWAQFLHALVLAQSCFMNCAVTAVVNMTVYNEMNKYLELKENVPPYALGARFCVDRVRQWEKQFEIPEPVEMIFEEGDLGQCEFSQIMAGEGSLAPIYKKKNEFIGLQAADQYAWEIARRLKDEQKEKQLGREFDPRIELRYLYDSIPKLHIEPTEITLAHISQMKGIKARK
jgi:hypothetical protein